MSDSFAANFVDASLAYFILLTFWLALKLFDKVSQMFKSPTKKEHDLAQLRIDRPEA